MVVPRCRAIPTTGTRKGDFCLFVCLASKQPRKIARYDMALCKPSSLQRRPTAQVKRRIVELLDQLNRDGEQPTRGHVAHLCQWSGLTVDECVGAIDDVLVEQERLVRQAQRAYIRAKRAAAAERAADPCVLF